MRAPPRERRYAVRLGLVGFDQEIEAAGIDIAFLIRMVSERAYTQSVRTVRMVGDHGDDDGRGRRHRLRIDAIFGRCRGNRLC